ncbi:BrnT family toxin [Komagataeibacter oboediens]|uniref:BrnT family toxin n=1 Tax=Komagataeibacter oboediens TaxID=65958 RepID=UPI000237DDC4|nr:BrnT family toxin [Komagataeibacter oboediens]
MTNAHHTFDWDDRKSEACLADRGFGFEDVIRIFAGKVIERLDNRRDYGELRVQAAGLIDGVPFMVVYTLRGDVTRIISARKMHLKEWQKWQE